MNILKLIIITLLTLHSANAYAEEIDYDALRLEGYGDVANVIQNMTPEQREELLKQATLRAEELQKMTPAEREALKRQLRATANTMNMDNIDVHKLDVSKAKSTDNVQKDMRTYHKKREQGKLNSPHVIQPEPKSK